MSTTTAKYGLTKPEDADALTVVVGDQLRATMDRLDLLLGEGGTVSLTPSAADTIVTQRVNYQRDYTATGVVPHVMLCLDSNVGSSNVVNFWATAPDYTGFTLNLRKSTTSATSVRWMARPLIGA